MIDSPTRFFTSSTRSEWLRMRTLVLLRWVAIIGQGSAILMATKLLHIDLALDLCATAIGASIAYNIAATVVFPENNRLSEKTATLTLLFDLGQLAFLLFLTGGLGNPFAILMLAPVIIAATTLSLRATILLGVVFILTATVLLFYAEPLLTTSGQAIRPPDILLYGTWAALVTSVVFVGIYARRVTLETYSMSDALSATQLALGREQQLTTLGGVVAAAAHELGTPLATIKLVAVELIDDLADHPELRKDAALIAEQADRCRDILRDMGRSGKEDMHLRNAPVSAVLQEAAEPHQNRGKIIIFRINGIPVDTSTTEQPEIPRHAEIIHGLRNLVQNAVDFATKYVWIDIDWDDDHLRVHVGDDGPGYPADLIGRIGDPFVRKRGSGRHSSTNRAEYEGMGLGLFIAKTLLERSGAHLTFANGTENPGRVIASSDTPAELSRATGAIVEVVWKRTDIETKRSLIRGPLGLNKPLVWPQ